MLKILFLPKVNMSQASHLVLVLRVKFETSTWNIKHNCLSSTEVLCTDHGGSFIVLVTLEKQRTVPQAGIRVVLCQVQSSQLQQDL